MIPENFIEGDGGQCWHCDQPCTTIEINFEAYLHPGACEDAKWAEYWEATRIPTFDIELPGMWEDLP